MLKPVLIVGLFQVLASNPALVQADDMSCDNIDSTSWIDVTVHGVMSDEGQIRAQIYSDLPDEFLRKGTKLVRVDVPSRADQVMFCVPLPGPGQYSLVVMHDRKANGYADFYTDGFGFSNNPRLTYSAPNHADTLFTAGDGGMALDVFLRYMLFGRLSSGDPWALPATKDNTHQDGTLRSEQSKSLPEMY